MRPKGNFAALHARESGNSAELHTREDGGAVTDPLHTLEESSSRVPGQRRLLALPGLLCWLLETAGLTQIRANEPAPDIGEWMDAIRAAARTIEVAPGHPLDRLLFLWCNLGNFMRTLALPNAVEQWSLTSRREKLIKIGVKIVRHGRYVTFQMAEVVIPRDLFADILRRIDRLRPPPAPA